MTFKFILSFIQLNLLSFSLKKQIEVIKKSGLTIAKSVKIFEYKKNNDGYLNGAKLNQQVIDKIFSIDEVLYLGY